MTIKNHLCSTHGIALVWLAASMVLVAAEVWASASAASAAVVESGKKLVAESKCEACHAARLGGDGSAMYTRKDRHVTSKSKLLTQVGRCNNTLNLGLFPDDEAAIAAYLDATHYKFKD